MMDNRNTGTKKTIMKTMTRAVAALMLCLTLVAGAALDGPAYADTGVSPYNGKTYTHNSRFSGYVVANGVDVSYHQNTNSNWVLAKAAGIDYAILRVTYTSINPLIFDYDNIDSRFAAHYANAKAAGVMTGVYVFSQARTVDDAVKEANFAVQRLNALGIKPNDLDLPVYFDYETNTRLTKKYLNTSVVNAFCNVIRAAGYQPGVYASLTVYNNYVNINQIPADVDIWCAQYNTSCGLAYRYSKWQYTSTGKVNGIMGTTGLFQGSVDCNFWYLNPNSDLNQGSVVSGGGGVYAFTGAPIQPSISVASGGRMLTQGVDYKLSYINNVAKGTAYALIRGIGNYSGYRMVPFTIGDKGAAAVSVPSTKIKSLSSGRKCFTVNVSKKKKGQVDGYQVRYSTHKSMADSVVKTIGYKYSKTKKKVKTSKSNTKLYVQVRSFKVEGGVAYYSNWSAAKKVKVR